MTENTAVTLNLGLPNLSTVVYAKQNDRLARHIVATLVDGSAAWTPPAGSAAIIRYLKPDGTGGFYDTDEDENAAISVTGNVATLTIAEQALTVPGNVYMELNFYTGAGEKVTTFTWLLVVKPSVLEDATIVSSDYYNVLTAAIAAGAAVAQALTFPVPIANGGTGATTAAGARANLSLSTSSEINAITLLRGTSIPSGANLDDYTTPGAYYIANGTVAGAIYNNPYPTGNSILLVKQGGSTSWISQILQCTGNARVMEYRRTFDAGNVSWSDWTRVLNDQQDFPVSIANGGTNATTAANARKNLGLTHEAGTTLTISSSVLLAGIITSDSKQINLDFVTPGLIAAGVTVTATALTGNVRGVGGYIESSSNPDWVASSSYTVTTTQVAANRVRFAIGKSTAFTNSTNNTPVVFWGSLTLSFS